MASVPERERLLSEGLTSYLNAVAALRSFREQVSRMCRTECERMWSDIQSSLKISTSHKVLDDYSEPTARSEGVLDPTYAYFGVGFDIPRLGDFYVGICWWSEDEHRTPPLQSWLSLGLQHKAKAARVGRLLSKLSNQKIKGPDESDYGDYELYTGRLISKPTPAACRKALRDDLKIWVSAWRQAGGVSKILEARG